jgi:hypothetical protein
MSDFINTIDVLGDDAVIDGIIQKTIAEFKDDQVTSVGNYAFYGCDNLTSVVLPVATYVNPYAFKGCSSLTELELPNVTGLAGYCFDDCTSLTSLNLPSVIHIGNDSVCRNGTALRTVNLPSATTTGGPGWFDGCVNLANVNMPLMRVIHNRAFKGCSSLESLRFSACTEIYSNSFENSALEALILENGAMCRLSHINSFANTPIASGTGYIYVPRALIEDYKAATNWSTYADQFRALEDYTVDGTVTGKLDETKI